MQLYLEVAPSLLEFLSFEQLTLNDVSYSVGTTQILKKINVTITKDEGITGIVGPSGSGKTTFLRLLNKLISPSQGEITLNISYQYSTQPSRELRKRLVCFIKIPSSFLAQSKPMSNMALKSGTFPCPLKRLIIC